MKIQTFTILLACFFLTGLHAQTVKAPFTLDGSVTASVQQGDTVFIGGTFTRILRPEELMSYGGPVDMSTGELVSGWPKPNGAVLISIPDGNGGFYLGGDFTMMDNQPRTRIAHIDQNGALTQQLAGVSFNAGVSCLKLRNNILYVGGSFTSAGDANTASITRNRLAAIDLGLNTLTPWNPNSGGNIGGMDIVRDTLYVGGGFTSMGGASRTYLATVSLLTGAVGPWAPVISGGTGEQVNGVIAAGDTVFVYGRFLSFDGQSRVKLVAVTGSTLLPWNPGIWAPNLSSTVTTMLVSGNLLYVGGGFDSIGTGTGFRHRGLAAIDRTTGLPTNWCPAIPASFGAFYSMLLHNDILYVVGNFTNTSRTIGSQVRLRAAALDVNQDTSMALPWAPAIYDLYPMTIGLSGNNLYIGGYFTQMGKSYTRNRLAAFRSSTNALLDWDPNVTGNITAMAVSKDGKKVFVGGNQLTNIGGVTVNHLGAIDVATGACDAGWVGDIPSGNINAMVTSPNALYVGGSFTTVAGQTYNRLVSLDLVTGAPSTTWTPGVGGTVYALALKGDTLYVGGSFTSVTTPGSAVRNRAFSINTLTGTLTTWNPNLAGGTPEVRSLLINDSILFIGGTFTTYQGTSRARIAAVSLNNFTLLSTWNPNSNNTISYMAAAGNALYVAGAVTSFGGTSGVARPGIALLNAASGALASWNPGTIGTVSSLIYSNHTLYTGLSATPWFVAITGDMALPVSFKSITASKERQDVAINWSTATETNNSHFEVERSADGENFSAVGSVRGAGTSAVIKNYHLTDRAAFITGNAPVLYYRVKQVDFNGQSSYSNVVSVRDQDLQQNVVLGIYPNPGKEEFVFDFNGAKGLKQIEVFNLNGKRLYLASSTNDMEQVVLKDYAEGIYLVKVATADGVTTKRLMIGR